MTRCSITLIDAIGTPITVYAQDLQDLRTQQRYYGRLGMHPDHPLPAGGIQLPFAQHETFDWSLIGARPWTNPEGQEGIARSCTASPHSPSNSSP